MAIIMMVLLWNLAKNYLHYYYSSARFYETGEDELGFLNKRFMDREIFRVPRNNAQITRVFSKMFLIAD